MIQLQHTILVSLEQGSTTYQPWLSRSALDGNFLTKYFFDQCQSVEFNQLLLDLMEDSYETLPEFLAYCLILWSKQSTWQVYPRDGDPLHLLSDIALVHFKKAAAGSRDLPACRKSGKGSVSLQTKTNLQNKIKLLRSKPASVQTTVLQNLPALELSLSPSILLSSKDSGSSTGHTSKLKCLAE